MQTTILSSSEPVLNKANLDLLKRHILDSGKRCTYSNMFNNNPCWELPEFNVYLNPDPGPNGHPQWNIDCDITRSDFNTLVVKRNRTGSPYETIDFRQGEAVSIRIPSRTTHSEISEIKNALEAAVLTSLKAIKAREDAKSR